MPDAITLSICIPTLNRAPLLDQLLAQIGSDCPADLEVVVADGGSSDETTAVVERHRSAFKALTYHRRPSPVGIDRDMALAVELARGEYCWLMSDDDGFTPGALRVMARYLRDRAGVYVANRIVCDVNLRPLARKAWMASPGPRTWTNLASREEMAKYLSLCKEFGALFSYCSALVVRREAWMAQVYPQDFDRSGYAHVLRILRMIGAGASVCYVPEHLILNRSFNDSFLAAGVVGRFLIDVDGYRRIAGAVYAEDEALRRQFLGVMKLEHPWFHLLKVRAAATQREWEDLVPKLIDTGYAPATVRFCGQAGRLRPLVRAAIAAKKLQSRSPARRWGYKLREFIAHRDRSSADA